MSLPTNPKIGDTFVHKDGETYEYVQKGTWVIVGSNTYTTIKRRQNYPDIGNQLDMIYHEISTNGSISVDGEWMTTIKNIKESFPKS